MPGHLVLKGERISLWTITREDIREVWKYYGDFELRRYISKRWQPMYYEDEEKWYESLVKNKEKHIVFCIVENSSNKLIGMVGLHKIDFYSKHAELGYWIWKEYWNRGYATEAVKLMLEYAFEYLSLNKVWARVFEPNKPSIRVLEKNGFKLVGRLKKHEYIPKVGYVDELYYEILKEEWNLNIEG